MIPQGDITQEHRNILILHWYAATAFFTVSPAVILLHEQWIW